jgi:hypothetical protein
LLVSIISIDITAHLEKPSLSCHQLPSALAFGSGISPYMHFSQEVSEEIRTDKRVERGTGNQTVNKRREKGRKIILTL